MEMTEFRLLAARLTSICHVYDRKEKLLEAPEFIGIIRSLFHTLPPTRRRCITEPVDQTPNPTITKPPSKTRKRTLSEVTGECSGPARSRTPPKAQDPISTTTIDGAPRPITPSTTRDRALLPGGTGKTRLGRVQENNTPIVPVQELLPFTRLWAQDPNTFFRRQACQSLDPCTTEPEDNFPSVLLRLVQGQHMGKVRSDVLAKEVQLRQRRVGLIGMYMLATIFGRDDVPASLTNGNQISESEVRKGKRYCRFLSDLGNLDILIAFSNRDIPKSTLEEHWPLADGYDDHRKNLITSLEQRGIHTAAGQFKGLTVVLLGHLFEKAQEYASEPRPNGESYVLTSQSWELWLAQNLGCNDAVRLTNQQQLSELPAGRVTPSLALGSQKGPSCDDGSPADNTFNLPLSVTNLSTAATHTGNRRTADLPNHDSGVRPAIPGIPGGYGRDDVSDGAQSLLHLANSGGSAHLHSSATPSQSMRAVGPEAFDFESFVYVNQPTFIPLRRDLEERWKGTWRLDWNGCPKKPLKRGKLVAQIAEQFPPELVDLVSDVGEFIHPILEKRVNQPLRFNSVALSLQSGAPKDEFKARISAVMHLLRTQSDQTLPRFVRDRTDEYFQSDNRLHLSIIEEDMCITTTDEEEERFVWIKFFTEKDWDWVDGKE
ncbi:hypothetical protein PGQ11_002827 [Apiospora arundinis]|uniref:Uncharacterized protein n=1 Tax=Apiospora arundinis TaxID=335852 RepID=A0ABR2J373_9PEZI